MNSGNFKFRLIGNQLLISLGLLFAFISPSYAGGVMIKSFGHSALLVKGGGHSILLNPFKAVGCAKKLAEPKG